MRRKTKIEDGAKMLPRPLAFFGECDIIVVRMGENGTLTEANARQGFLRFGKPCASHDVYCKGTVRTRF